MGDVPRGCSRQCASWGQSGFSPLASSQAWASFYFQASGKPLLFRAVNLPPVSNTPSESYGSISVHGREGQGRFSYSVFPAYSPRSLLIQLSPVQFEMHKAPE